MVPVAPPCTTAGDGGVDLFERLPITRLRGLPSMSSRPRPWGLRLRSARPAQLPELLFPGNPPGPMGCGLHVPAPPALDAAGSVKERAADLREYPENHQAVEGRRGHLIAHSMGARFS